MSDAPLTAQQVAEYLQCSVQHVRKLCQCGALKCSRLPSPISGKIGPKAEYRIRQSAVEEMLGIEPIRKPRRKTLTPAQRRRARSELELAKSLLRAGAG